MDIEKQMQEEINRQREIHNRVLVRDPVTGRREYREGWRPGDKGYLPPATDFRRLPKTKQKKLMRW